MVQTLIQNNAFNGKYVAIRSFEDRKVVDSGDTPEEAYTKAIQKGCKNPVVMFVPVKDMVQIY